MKTLSKVPESRSHIMIPRRWSHDFAEARTRPKEDRNRHARLDGNVWFPRHCTIAGAFTTGNTFGRFLIRSDPRA